MNDDRRSRRSSTSSNKLIYKQVMDHSSSKQDVSFVPFVGKPIVISTEPRDWNGKLDIQKVSIYLKQLLKMRGLVDVKLSRNNRGELDLQQQQVAKLHDIVVYFRQVNKKGSIAKLYHLKDKTCEFVCGAVSPKVQTQLDSYISQLKGAYEQNEYGRNVRQQLTQMSPIFEQKDKLYFTQVPTDLGYHSQIRNLEVKWNNPLEQPAPGIKAHQFLVGLYVYCGTDQSQQRVMSDRLFGTIVCNLMLLGDEISKLHQVMNTPAENYEARCVRKAEVMDKLLKGLAISYSKVTFQLMISNMTHGGLTLNQSIADVNMTFNQFYGSDSTTALDLFLPLVKMVKSPKFQAAVDSTDCDFLDSTLCRQRIQYGHSIKKQRSSVAIQVYSSLAFSASQAMRSLIEIEKPIYHLRSKTGFGKSEACCTCLEEIQPIPFACGVMVGHYKCTNCPQRFHTNCYYKLMDEQYKWCPACRKGSLIWKAGFKILTLDSQGHMPIKACSDCQKNLPADCCYESAPIDWKEIQLFTQQCINKIRDDTEKALEKDLSDKKKSLLEDKNQLVSLEYNIPFQVKVNLTAIAADQESLVQFKVELAKKEAKRAASLADLIEQKKSAIYRTDVNTPQLKQVEATLKIFKEYRPGPNSLIVATFFQHIGVRYFLSERKELFEALKTIASRLHLQRNEKAARSKQPALTATKSEESSEQKETQSSQVPAGSIIAKAEPTNQSWGQRIDDANDIDPDQKDRKIPNLIKSEASVSDLISTIIEKHELNVVNEVTEWVDKKKSKNKRKMPSVVPSVVPDKSPTLAKLEEARQKRIKKQHSKKRNVAEAEFKKACLVSKEQIVKQELKLEQQFKSELMDE